MTGREVCEATIGVVAYVGVMAFITEPLWNEPAKAAAPAPIVKPFSARMGCPAWPQKVDFSDK